MPTSKRGEGRKGDSLLSRYTPSHYILDKGLIAGKLFNVHMHFVFFVYRHLYRS